MSSRPTICSQSWGASRSRTGHFNSTHSFWNLFVTKALATAGPHFILAVIEAGRTPVLPPRYDELENKYRFIRHVEELDGTSILRVAVPHSYAREHR